MNENIKTTVRAGSLVRYTDGQATNAKVLKVLQAKRGRAIVFDPADRTNIANVLVKHLVPVQAAPLK